MSRFFRRKGAVLFSAAVAALATLNVLGSPPAFAARPVRGLVNKPLTPAPDGATALRLSVYGDHSGAMLQVRLLAPGEDGILTGYFAAPPMKLDFEGWKTVVIPFDAFNFESETNPEVTQDGIGAKAALGQSAVLQVAVTTEKSTIYLADAGWTTASAGPTDAPLAPIDLTSDGDTVRARVAGDSVQIRSLTLAKNLEPPYNKDGKPSLRMVLRNPALAERADTVGLQARLKAQAGLPYALFTRPLFDPIESESTPTVAEAKAGVNLVITACADQIEASSFAVYSMKDLAAVTVKTSGNLSNGAGQTLPTNAVDVRIVRSAPVYNGPQLLVKDDHVPLSGASTEIRLTGDPTTSVTAGITKQFWITVRVPKNQAPGTYKGILTFAAQGVKSTSIPLTVEVPNLQLKASPLLYAMELRSLLSAGAAVPGASVVTPDLLAAQLVNIREHGFAIVLLDESGANLEAEMKAYKAAELRPSGLVFVSQAPNAAAIGQVDAARQSLSTPALPFTVYYYLSPSLVTAGGGDYVKAVKDADRNALVVAPVDCTATYTSLSAALGDTEGSKLAPIYSLSSDYAQNVLRTRKRTTSNKDFWTWSVADQNPVKNRLLAGYVTLGTGTTLPGFYGVFLGPYQNVPEGTDPYLAFTEAGASAPTLPRLLAYPVKGGSLDTVQWEAVREGIDDTRYMGVLKTYIRQIKDNDALRARYKTVTDGSELLMSGELDRASTALSPEQVQNNRMLVIKESNKLRDLLNPPAAPRPAPTKPAPAPAKPAAKPGKKP